MMYFTNETSFYLTLHEELLRFQYLKTLRANMRYLTVVNKILTFDVFYQHYGNPRRRRKTSGRGRRRRKSRRKRQKRRAELLDSLNTEPIGLWICLSPSSTSRCRYCPFMSCPFLLLVKRKRLSSCG